MSEEVALPVGRPKATRVVHHVLDGAKEMYHVDALHALGFKDEWKARPWKDAEVEAYKRREAKKAKGEVVADEPAASDEADD